VSSARGSSCLSSSPGKLEVRSMLPSDADFYTACISAVVDARKQQDIRPSAHQCCVLVCI
jgi:hypothetical protein